jgi:hypothetical protein
MVHITYSTDDTKTFISNLFYLFSLMNSLLDLLQKAETYN